MKLLLKYIVLFITGWWLFTACDTPSASVDTEQLSASVLTPVESVSPWMGGHATGEFRAQWEGCEDGEHEEPGDHEEGDCEGGHEEVIVLEEEECDEGHVDDGHEDEGCSGNRPARDFYVQFDAIAKKMTRGEVTFAGLGTYEGIDFNGSVTWVEPGREPHELFFGGEVTGGTVDRGCFLFSIQDNGEGNNAEADRLQYRLYGSSQAPCHLPDHFPRGYPIVVYEGNIQVH